ncbi:MAG: hypothetical protein AB1333_01985 [Patescibacteria group bacterium]
MTTEEKQCQNCKKIFTIDSEDFDFYKKIDVPPPMWCPECRMIRRMNWRNERTLYRRECGACKKKILTIYSQDSQLYVFCHECWNSDGWDPQDFSVEYNWNKNFFLQFDELFKKIPLVSADRKKINVNSEYGNYLGGCKNCYMCFSVAESENGYYLSNCQENKDCFDSSFLKGSEKCYEGIDGEKNFDCIFFQKTRESVSSSFLFNSANSSNCFMSANLKNKNYVFRGEQLDQVEYKKRVKEINFESYRTIEELKREYLKLKTNALCRNIEQKHSVGVTGDNITNSKDVSYSFDVNDSENVKFSLRILKGSKDIYDCHGMVGGELVYEGFGCGFSPRKNLFSFSIDTSRDMIYCAMCHNCSNCLASIGLRNKEYCILNKQYTKEEYELLLPKIKQHMFDMPYIDQKGRTYTYGEFFPPELSPFGYNETIAQEYFPLTKEQALAQGFSWKDPEEKNYTITKKPEDLPDTITDAPDSITSEVIGCMHQGTCTHQCTTAFKIIPEELEFYRRMHLPLPRLCPNCRHYERLAQRNPLKLWKRQCMCDKSTHRHNGVCPNEFETSYAPERKEIVYCEQCYQAEVV